MAASVTTGGRPGSLRAFADVLVRFWPVALIGPVLFGVAGAAVLVIGHGDGAGVLHDRAWSVLMITKWLAIPGPPILLHRLAQRVREQPGRWRTATLVWVGMGVAAVVASARWHAAIATVVDGAAYRRLWPTGGAATPASDAAITEGFGPLWSVGSVVSIELVAVVAVAVVAGLTLRVVRDDPPFAAVAVPTSVFVVLALYGLLTPWAVVADYDFFVGDALLGAMLFELGLFFGPIDPLAAVAIGIGSLSIAALGGRGSRRHEARGRTP